VYLFTDDAKLYKTVLCENDHDHRSLQTGLNALQQWSDNWLLELNANKCKTVFYGRNIDHGYKHSLHSAELENIFSIKDLGVFFYPDLSFSQHCKEKTNKAHAMLGIIRR